MPDFNYKGDAVGGDWGHPVMAQVGWYREGEQHNRCLTPRYGTRRSRSLGRDTSAAPPDQGLVAQ